MNLVYQKQFLITDIKKLTLEDLKIYFNQRALYWGEL
jgi:hypothetical protein